MRLRLIPTFLFFFVSLFLLSCHNSGTNENNSNTERDTVKTVKEKIAELTFETIPSGKKDFKVGEIPEVKISHNDSTMFDSIAIFVNNKQMVAARTLPIVIKISEKNEKPGTTNIEAYV
jgi:hypothetical protein